MTNPQPADEPALQEALVHIIATLVAGIGGGSLLVALHLTPEAGTLIISAVVAAVLHATQGWRTRSRVFSPLSAQQKIAEAPATADGGARVRAWRPSAPDASPPVGIEPVAIHAD